jgi:hypothetical protein
MKKTIILFLAIVTVIGLYAFSPSKSHKQKKQTVTAHIWWDFNGTDEQQMAYNYYYSPDPNNFPDCAPAAGLIYCEIYASTDSESDPEDPKPDLSTITAYRMRPL